MTAFHIKILALVTMLIDHIGLFFFPGVIWFRIIGRLSFPLFAWLIANGAVHTKNTKAYVGRLFVFALIAQLPFFMTNRLLDSHFLGLNVLFTLLFGLIACVVIKRFKNPRVWILATTILASAAQFLRTDYGAMGVVMIVLFYLYFTKFRILAFAQSMLITAYSLFIRPNIIGFVGMVSLVIIAFYNGKRGPKATYLFYILYPLQYVVFYILLKHLG